MRGMAGVLNQPATPEAVLGVLFMLSSILGWSACSPSAEVAPSFEVAAGSCSPRALRHQSHCAIIPSWLSMTAMVV
ncbi:MAG: hypothetical protein J3K34DRAFT_429962, partial [Monoraphidium minutum]